MRFKPPGPMISSSESFLPRVKLRSRSISWHTRVSNPGKLRVLRYTYDVFVVVIIPLCHCQLSCPEFTIVHSTRTQPDESGVSGNHIVT